jgi:hypothetical protein
MRVDTPHILNAMSFRLAGIRSPSSRGAQHTRLKGHGDSKIAKGLLFPTRVGQGANLVTSGPGDNQAPTQLGEGHSGTAREQKGSTSFSPGGSHKMHDRRSVSARAVYHDRFGSHRLSPSSGASPADFPRQGDSVAL